MQQGLFKRALAEFIGTFLFVLIAAGSVCAIKLSNYGGLSEGFLVVTGLASGLGLMVMVYGTAHISGGVMNPAVAVGLWICKRLTLGAALVYSIAECLGALLAGLFLRIIYWVYGLDTNYGTPAFKVGDITWYRVSAMELVFTFALMWVVMSCVVDARRQGKQFFGFCYGAAYAVLVFAGGSSITQSNGSVPMACMNPARYLGPAVSSGYIWQAGIYILPAFIGAFLAALLYRNVFLQTAASPEDEA